MTNFRTQETHDKYEAAKAEGHLISGGCRLCEAESLKEYTHFRIIDNRFPYDKIAEIHHMIVPNRHVTEHDFLEDERKELLTLKETILNEEYIFALEALPRTKSIPSHFHLHLIVPKSKI